MPYLTQFIPASRGTPGDAVIGRGEWGFDLSVMFLCTAQVRISLYIDGKCIQGMLSPGPGMSSVVLSLKLTSISTDKPACRRLRPHRLAFGNIINGPPLMIIINRFNDLAMSW